MAYTYARTAARSRPYSDAEEDSGEIAKEVVMGGSSKGWTAEDADDMWVASEIEGRLKRFNIGYIDDMAGGWGPKSGGSNFFAAEAKRQEAAER